MEALYKIPIPTESNDKKPSNPFLKSLYLTDRKVYDYYREHRYDVAPAINQYNYFVKAVEGMFNIIQKFLTESENGVYIEGIGYFAVESKRNKKRNGFSKSLLKRYTVSKQIKVYFIPDKMFEGWSIDRTADKWLKLNLKSSEIDYKVDISLKDSVKNNIESTRSEYNRTYKTIKADDLKRIY